MDMLYAGQPQLGPMANNSETMDTRLWGLTFGYRMEKYLKTDYKIKSKIK